MKTVENIAKEAIKTRVITGVRFEKVQIGHSRDRAPMTSQVDARRTNHDREFCYRYDYRPNWTPLSPITIIYKFQNLCITFHLFVV